jgi:thioredoxin 1
MIVPKSVEQLQQLIQNQEIVVVKYSASWCGPCQILRPIFEGLSVEYAPKGVKLVEVDVRGDWTEFAIEQGARQVPYTQIFVKGQLYGFVKGAQAEGIRKGIESAVQFVLGHSS